MTDLGFNRVPALLTQIHKVQHAALQMRERSDALHLDGVHLLEGMVEDTGGINHLPAQVLVVQMADKERLGGERVRLHVNVRAGDLVDEGRLADVRVATDEEGAGIGVDGGETGYVLPDLLEVGQRVFLTAHDGSHTTVFVQNSVMFGEIKGKGRQSGCMRPEKHSPTERSALELLAAIQTVTKLEETDVVLRDLVNKVPCRARLAEGELVVVFVVKHVHEGRQERMEILHPPSTPDQLRCPP